MNILILNGSPHPNGNTAALINAFTEGAESRNHKVTMIPVALKNISGCKACEYCHNNGKENCIQQDDMLEVYEKLEQTDLLVFASPVYYWSWSGQLQNTVSRFYPYGPVKVKKCALLLTSASADVYDAPISQYYSMLKYFGAENIGIYTSHGEQNKSEEIMEEVRNFGASL